MKCAGAPVRPRFLEKSYSLFLAVRCLDHMGHCMHRPRRRADYGSAHRGRHLPRARVRPSPRARRRKPRGRSSSADCRDPRQAARARSNRAAPATGRERNRRPAPKRSASASVGQSMSIASQASVASEARPAAHALTAARWSLSRAEAPAIAVSAARSAAATSGWSLRNPPIMKRRRDRNAAECKAGIDGERLLESADRVAGKRVIVGDCAIESLCRRLRAGERQPLLVLGH